MHDAGQRRSRATSYSLGRVRQGSCAAQAAARASVLAIDDAAPQIEETRWQFERACVREVLDRVQERSLQMPTILTPGEGFEGPLEAVRV